MNGAGNQFDVGYPVVEASCSGCDVEHLECGTFRKSRPGDILRNGRRDVVPSPIEVSCVGARIVKRAKHDGLGVAVVVFVDTEIKALCSNWRHG